MAGVTSIVSDHSDTPSRKVRVARTAGSAALGYLVPWSRPARKVVAHVVHSHSNAPQPRRRVRSRLSGRTALVVLGIGGVVAGGVAFSVIRRGRHTPPPIAAHPPRVEDVPTR